MNANPASVYQGPEPGQPNYQQEENVTLAVSWPEDGKSGFAVCSITIKRGEKIVSRSKIKIRVDSW